MNEEQVCINYNGQFISIAVRRRTRQYSDDLLGRPDGASSRLYRSVHRVTAADRARPARIFWEPAASTGRNEVWAELGLQFTGRRQGSFIMGDYAAKRYEGVGDSSALSEGSQCMGDDEHSGLGWWLCAWAKWIDRLRALAGGIQLVRLANVRQSWIWNVGGPGSFFERDGDGDYR